MCGNVNMRVRDSVVMEPWGGCEQRGGGCAQMWRGNKCSPWGYGDTRWEGGYSLLFGSQEFAGKRP